MWLYHALIVSLVAYTLASAQGSAATTTITSTAATMTAAPTKAKKVEKYRVLTKDDGFKCFVRYAEIRYGWDTPPDGRIVSFVCLNRRGDTVRIPLAKNFMVKGQIVTEEFGMVRMEMKGIAYFTGRTIMQSAQQEGTLIENVRYFMTPSQIRQFRKHLG